MSVQSTLNSVIGPDAPARVDGGGEYLSRNPANLEDVVAKVSLGGPETLPAATEQAQRAQREWAQVPAPVRGRVVAGLGRLVEANKESLARLVTREIGKPYAEALGEVQEIIDTCDFFLGEGRRLYGQTVPSEMPDKQLFTFRVPVGVAVVITAGNFPVAVPSWYMVPALLCGNAVVWKPAEYAAGAARALAELAWRAGVPKGVLNLVYTDGEATFKGLESALAAGTVNKVGFTGSSAVGARVGELCGRYLQSPCLELGGKNPMIVAPDAELDLAVEGALFSGWGTAGQRCTSLGNLIVHRDVHDEFIRRLDAALRAAAIGDPTGDVLYGPMLDQKFADNFETILGTIADHHTVLGSESVGRIGESKPRKGFRGDASTGLYYHPVLLDGLRPDDHVFRNETFGPIVGVTTYDTLDEAIELGNAPGYGLSAAIYTTDPATAFRFREGIGAGMVSVNNSTSGAEAHLPFGGNGKSGNGSRQSGIWVLDQFTRWQSLNWDFSGKLQKAQMDVDTVEPELDFRLPPELGGAR
ncbi:aldehyde dehydrogenase family protein [Saccharopolyspora phatthalungensis]|uniref:aldehyde dehydrogenase (NAD(+)) n=1 Tax=Saccharopolyspora phatthalungensis TaxID=664693 RepID=A0A840QBT2_9PSEU|nr:aldehyde dehydrogenase family protein [Saccharopolyspora phatthalungensis]MBB5157866.1 aldehyde dehydrogenase (NAD+) [Saccharopolyspora phatthalungensis]